MSQDITMTTSRASLCALGEYLKRHCVFAPLREQVHIRQKTVRYRPFDTLLDGLCRAVDHCPHLAGHDSRDGRPAQPRLVV
jgi:hypothetical protein